MRDTGRTRAALATLLAASLALIAVSYLGGSAPLRAAGGAVFGPAERAINSVTRPIASFFDGAAAAPALTARLGALQRRLIRLRAKLSSEQLDRSEYAQLVRLLKLAGGHGYHVVAANVIAVGQGYDQTVTLDVGSRDGISPEETVLDGAGLIGTVTGVSPWTCTVLLATDPTAVVGVRLAGSGQIGWVRGTGRSFNGPDLLLHVLGTDNVLAPGQQVVTSASVGDRPYVPGIPVGVIASVKPALGASMPTALVRPYAEFSALDIVGVVVVPPRRAQRG